MVNLEKALVRDYTRERAKSQGIRPQASTETWNAAGQLAMRSGLRMMARQLLLKNFYNSAN